LTSSFIPFPTFPLPKFKPTNPHIYHSNEPKLGLEPRL
jgi:hypothetical protein